jgi:hypothetical protein
VSCDGPWQHFPHTGVNSPDEQHNALSGALNASGVPHVEMPYHGAWESQVAKRNALYGYAIDATHPDWLLLIDGDEWILTHQPTLRDALTSTVEDIATVGCWNHHKGKPLGRHPKPATRLVRGIPGLRVEGAHNGIRHPDGTWLHGPSHIRRNTIRAHLGAHLTLGHDWHQRPHPRTQASRRYYQTRFRKHLEHIPREGAPA